MREQTYNALQEICSHTGNAIEDLTEILESFPWNVSDQEAVQLIRLFLYYLHRPELLTPEEYSKAADVYKHQQKRWNIKIS